MANRTSSSSNETPKATSPKVVGTEGNNVLSGTLGNDEVFGLGGDDRLFGDNTTGDGFKGGNDFLDGGDGKDLLFAGFGDDTLSGGAGNDFMEGGLGVDTLTGGSGSDTFVFEVNSQTAPDVVTDFLTGEDDLNFTVGSFGSDFNRTIAGNGGLKFQRGESSKLSGDSNLLVLTDVFPNAGAAAKAIADNNALTANEGLFVYFNTTLGITRFVHSSDLSSGAKPTVLANLTNQTNPANLANFSATDFSFSALT
jgi:serralysin